MSNDQSQTPTGESDKNDQKKNKTKTKTRKIKTTTMINVTTKATKVMGVIQERLHRLTHEVVILRVNIRESG